MKTGLSFGKKYFIISFITIIIAGGVSYYIVNEKLKGSITRKEFSDLTQSVQFEAGRSLDLSRATSLRLSGDLEKFRTETKNIPKVKDIKIIDPNGTVVSSGSKEEIGQSYISDPKVKEAINGSGQIMAAAENDFLETLIPFSSNDGTIRGVAMVKSIFPTELKKVPENAFQTSAIIVALMIILNILYYVIFSGDEKDMFEKDRALADKSRALGEERQLDEAIMSSVAESLVAINKDGQIIIFNPEAERILGHKLEDIEYRHYKKIIKLYDKEGKEFPSDPFLESIKSGEKRQFKIKDQVYVKDGSGNLTPISLNIAPMVDEEKKVRGIVATITDITTEKELDKVKDEFVYVVAHELGNPIFALDGYLSILEGQLPKNNKKDLDILHMAQSVNQQLSGLVNDLLEVVRNEQGTLSFEINPIDITEILGTVIKNASFKADGKKISLKYHKIKVPKAFGNEQKIKEILTNLVDNAIKYTPEGGRVEITHELTGKGIITHVKDSGFGMSEEEQEHLFDKFYRVKNEKTKGISGTGLGLFICKQIIEKCNGEIWATSEEGKGSTFSFSLHLVNQK